MHVIFCAMADFYLAASDGSRYILSTDRAHGLHLDLLPLRVRPD
jgi:hypothetical protein